MKKRGWVIVAWLGLIASSSALASNQVGGVAVQAPSTFDHQKTVAAADQGSYINATTGSARSAAVLLVAI